MYLLTHDRISRVLFWGCASGLLSQFLYILGIANFYLAFITVWAVTAGTYLAKASLMLTPDGKAVFISGCDTGFGHAVALHLHKLGFRVFAGCLFADKGGEGSQKLKDMKSDRLHVLQLDVTKEDDIKNAVKTISETLGTKEVLWGVINNAAIATYGAVEWVSMATYRKVLDVNLFGVLALTKACLPLIRKAKGRVLTVSSARGRMASPLGTTYEATKFAIEGISDGLRHEMKSFGVDVCIIEPGNYCAGTNVYNQNMVRSVADAMWKDMDEEVREAYGGKDVYEKTRDFQCAISPSGNPDVSPVVEAMTDALMQRYPQERYTAMGLFIYTLTFISQHFPEWVYDYVCLEILMKLGW